MQRFRYIARDLLSLCCNCWVRDHLPGSKRCAECAPGSLWGAWTEHLRLVAKADQAEASWRSLPEVIELQNTWRRLMEERSAQNEWRNSWNWGADAHYGEE